VFVGHSETGAVFEQSVQLVFNHTLKLRLRRIVVRLHQPTRDGDAEIAVLSNLPIAYADAVQIAALYQKRWRIERLFQVLEQCFRGEINTLAYPRAALFGFVMALICYNLLAVAQAAMRSVHGAALSRSISLLLIIYEIQAERGSKGLSKGNSVLQFWSF
jgi:IS4 transposase